MAHSPPCPTGAALAAIWIVRIHSRIEIVEDSLRVDVADPHQSERCAEDHRRHPVLMNNKRLPRRKILHCEIDRQRYRVTSGRGTGFDVFAPPAQKRKINDLQPDLGELLAHTDCHRPRFFRQLACEHDVVDLDERIEVSRGRGVVRGN